MTPYLKSFGRITWTWNNVGTITSSSHVLGYSDQVICPTSNRGNMVDPTPWNYSVARILRHYGKKETLTPGDALIAGLHGVIDVPQQETRSQKDAVYNMALNRLNDKVRGNLDLSIALAESGTTARMVRNTLKVLRHARKLKPPGGFGSTRDVANGYLQFKYGWKPLLSDVYNAANESIRVVVNKLEHTSASARIPEGRKYVREYASYGSSTKVPVERTVSEGSFSGCKIGISLEIPPDSFRLDRWTSVNPVSIAWELVPYSFVVDWFFDIGSYLRNIETGLLLGGRFRSGYVSEIWRSEVTDELTNWVSPVNQWNQKHRYTENVGERLDIIFTRARLSNYPFPRKPTINVDLGSGQLFSAAALLRQLMSDPSSASQQQPSRRGRAGIWR